MEKESLKTSITEQMLSFSPNAIFLQILEMITSFTAFQVTGTLEHSFISYFE